MGAGKSTVGALVAHALGWSFHDADAVLEDTHGLSIPELFTLHGEAHFRALEEATVAALLALDHCVIALGGGAIESPRTRSRLVEAPKTHLVFLHVPLALALDRCGGQAVDRPLLADRARLEQRYAARLPFYESAHQTIDTAAVTAGQAARQIIDQVLAVSARERMP